ncbi:MAG: phage holin family protein [Desulfuromonadaceae bacterium]
MDLDRLFQINFKPVWAFLFAAFNYIVCPNASYMPAIAAVWAAVIIDILTRLFANSRNNGGFFKAIRVQAISSDTLWNRTVVKVVAYLSLQILAGLSLRVLPLEQLSIAVSTIVYSFLFIREATSVVENLIEAGADDLKPLLFWLRKKESNLTDYEAGERGEDDRP